MNSDKFSSYKIKDILQSSNSTDSEMKPETWLSHLIWLSIKVDLSNTFSYF